LTWHVHFGMERFPSEMVSMQSTGNYVKLVEVFDAEHEPGPIAEIDLSGRSLFLFLNDRIARTDINERIREGSIREGDEFEAYLTMAVKDLTFSPNKGGSGGINGLMDPSYYVMFGPVNEIYERRVQWTDRSRATRFLRVNVKGYNIHLQCHGFARNFSERIWKNDMVQFAGIIVASGYPDPVAIDLQTIRHSRRPSLYRRYQRPFLPL